jgi:hypothetical protein
MLQKEVSRKEFLTMAGFGIASIFGFSSIIKLLTGSGQHRSSGYGSNNYGGGKRNLA